MIRLEISGMPFLYGPHSVGFAGNGPSTAAGAIRRIRALGLGGLNVLDICCGIGVVGLLIRKELGSNVIASLALADSNIFNLEAVRATLQLNGWDDDSTIISFLTDGLMGIPQACQFDLIVSNPPHCAWPDDQALETPSELGTHDRGWRFHRQFYERCHDYLRPDGQVWFLENSATDSEHISREAIAGNSALRLLRRYEARDDPGFFWMITERVCR